MNNQEKKDMVMMSLMWSLTISVLGRYDGKGKQSLREIVRILGFKFSKTEPKELDFIEDLKVKTWVKLSEIYQDEIIVSIPQIVETLFWSLSEQPIELTRWVNSMASKVEYGKSSIKMSNKVVDEFMAEVDKILFAKKTDEDEFADWANHQLKKGLRKVS